MPYQTIISAEGLADNIHSSEWVILDCRGQFMSDTKSYADFTRCHIPNAYYCSFAENYLPSFSQSFSITDDATAKQQNMVNYLSDLGFDKTIQMIIYDNDSNEFTDTLWLHLRSLGYANVAVLQGGLEAWLDQDFPVTSKNSVHMNQKNMQINKDILA